MVQGLASEDESLAGEICAEAFDLGLVMETAGVNDQVAKIMPPLTIDIAILEKGLNIIETATASVIAKRNLENTAHAA